MQEMPQQQWQEESSGAGSGIGSEQSFVKSEKMPTVSAASFLHFPAQQDSQRPLELLQRSQGVQGPPQTALRPPSLAAKTSSLLQRKQQFYKTKMCPWFSRGRCDRGTSCQFAHNAMELRATPDLRRTSLCPRLKQLGRCVNRDCSYAHQPQELRATGEVYKTALCVKWQLGRCAVGNLCRHAHGPEEMRGLAVTASNGVASKKDVADPVTAAAGGAAAAAAAAVSSSGVSAFAEAPDGDVSSRSSLGSSSGNSSGSNSTCTSSPAPCLSPFAFSGAPAAAPTVAVESEEKEGMTAWTCGTGGVCLDYPMQLHNAIGWEQQQGRSVGTQSKGLSPQRHLPVTKAAAVIPAVNRKLPKAFQRQLRQQQQQQVFLVQPQRQGRPSHKDLPQQALQGGNRRRSLQQQQQNYQQQQLYPWMPRRQRLPWDPPQQEQHQHLSHGPLQQDLHIDSQQQPLLVRDALLLQQQQPATLQLQDGLWQQQEQHCLHPLADDCCMTFERTALSPENANPRLQQQQQTKALAYGPHLPQQQQHASWDHEGLLCIWDQPDVCWGCSSEVERQQQQQRDTAARAEVSGDTAFADAPIGERLMLLPQQQDVQGAGGDGVPRQQTQQLLDAHLRCSGGGIRATAAAAEAEAHLTPEEATRGGGETRPVPLEAPERSRISKTSEESPCSILFSGPQLFNVTVETE
ncbi:uncharacterized protein LOC34617604 [Cyclospora cayetanensis]|uniref:Uncharacterized protein LOC34617604 n=1 Tax=Cyclospora cayetanensis TaxID=88456 RepID=A0A6P6RUN8_9EIME|nr:uncharacterized protein LOC34617604 [Cyclospora cayetanensis]